MSVAAHLGGKMVYQHKVGVDRTDGEAFPQDFVPVMAESDLAEAKPTRAEHDGVPILLVRRGDRIFALAEICSHFSGPLSEGKLVGDSIVARGMLPGSRWKMVGCLMDPLSIRNPASRCVYRMDK